jgi:hypothetical protein
MPLQTYPPWFDYPYNISLELRILKLLIMQFWPTFCDFSLSGSNSFLTNLFLNTLRLCPLLNVWRQDLQTYKTTGEIIVRLYFIFVIFSQILTFLVDIL